MGQKIKDTFHTCMVAPFTFYVSQVEEYILSLFKTCHRNRLTKTPLLYINRHFTEPGKSRSECLNVVLWKIINTV